MPPWWQKPEKEEQPVSATEHEEPVEMTEEGKRKAWRLLALLDAMRHQRPSEPISLDEIDQLGRVAEGYHDLHDACAALRNGCALDLLARIYT